MNTHQPTFSIVMPIYNEEQYISEALESILAQTDSDWEAVLVDDGSTDRTPYILDEYAKKDSRFRVFHKTNGGQSTAINKGVQEAKGKWLCWLSGDDFFHPMKLELNRKWIIQNPDCRFFFAGCQFVYSDRRELDYSIPWLDLNDDDMRLVFLFRTNYLSGISICIYREAWLENIGFDENLRYAHDLDMWMRLMLTYKTHYEPDITCYMRFHSGQESNMFPLGCQFDASKAIIRLINKHPFEDLFYGVNLSRMQTSIDVVEKTLNIVACEQESNLLYGLGVHPALQLRILEWVWNRVPDPAVAHELKKIIQTCSNTMSVKFRQASFGLLWMAIYAATSIPFPRFKYTPIDPVDVGRKNYYYQNFLDKTVMEPLQSYLNRYDGFQVGIEMVPDLDWRKVGILLPPDLDLDNTDNPDFIKFASICDYLEQSGIEPLLIGKSSQTLGFYKGMLYLGSNKDEEIEQLLSRLNGLDCTVAITNDRASTWNLKNLPETITLTSEMTPIFAAEEIIKRIRVEKHNHKIKSIFGKITSFMKKKRTENQLSG